MLLRKFKHKAFMSFASFMLKFAPGVSYLVFAGDGSARSLCRHIAHNGAKKVFVVTDKPLVELGIVEQAIAGSDAVIDFSTPEASVRHAALAAKAGLIRIAPF